MSRYRAILSPVAVAALLVAVAGGVTASGGPGGAARPASAEAPAVAGVGTLATTAGCGRAPTLSSGTHTISSGGKSRSFILRIPENYDNANPYRLIFGFHWLNGTAVDVDTGQTVQRDTWSYYGLRRLANDSTIFVAPQGLNNGWANSGGEDVTFVDDMIRQLDAALCIDTTQRFALGFSYGGGMSFSLACSRPNVFRAVAVYAGAQLSGCSGGTQPIAYFAAHGLRDSVLNISNGRTLRDRFVSNNGCTPQSPPEPPQGSLRHITTAYAGCRAGYPVVWAAFDEDHTPAPQDGVAGAGPQTWIPGETWQFFTQFQGDPVPTTPPPGPTTPPAGPTTPAVTTPPVTTRPPTVPPVTTPPPVSGGCSAVVSVQSWTGGFVATVRVTAGSSGTNGWSVSLTLPSGASVTNVWNANRSGTSGAVSFTNVSYNGGLGAGQSTEFGFQGSGTAGTLTPTCTTR